MGEGGVRASPIGAARVSRWAAPARRRSPPDAATGTGTNRRLAGSLRTSTRRPPGDLRAATRATIVAPTHMRSATTAATNSAAGTASHPPSPNTPAGPGGCPAGQKALEELLRHVDRDQRERRGQPRAQQATAGRTVAGRLAPRGDERSQPRARAEADGEQDPRDERAEIRMPLLRELVASGGPERQLVAQLVHGERGHGNERDSPQSGRHAAARVHGRSVPGRTPAGVASYEDRPGESGLRRVRR